MNATIIPLGDRKWAVAGLLALLAIAIAFGAVQPVNGEGADVTLPEPTGPYAVGRSVYEWTDDARAESYSDDPDARRELLVSIWYPADVGAQSERAPYVPEALGEAIQQNFGVDVQHVQNNAYADVPVAGTTDGFPVLIFQPGNMTILFTYTALLEEIASHGYIVVGINPTYNAPLTVFSDGRMIPALPVAAQTDQAQADVWTADARYVADQLDQLNATDSRFAGKVDVHRLGFFGHSFGGASATSVCHVDPRCVAGIDIDGALRMDDPSVTQPFMLFFSEHPSCEQVAAENPGSTVEECETFIAEQTLNWDSVFSSAQPGYRIILSGSVHNSFTDNAFLLPLMPELGASLTGVTIDPQRAWRVTAGYVLAFYAEHLNGVSAPLLQAASSDYPEVSFERSDA